MARRDVIVTGDPMFRIDDRPAAGVGDVTARGDVITTGSSSLFMGPESRRFLPDQTGPTVREARDHVESTAWAFEANRPPYPDPEGTYKCNLFVYEMLNNSSKPVPTVEGGRVPAMPDAISDLFDDILELYLI